MEESQEIFWCRSKCCMHPYQCHSYYTASAPMYFLTGAQCSYTHIRPTCSRTPAQHQSKTWANQSGFEYFQHGKGRRLWLPPPLNCILPCKATILAIKGRALAWSVQTANYPGLPRTLYSDISQRQQSNHTPPMGLVHRSTRLVCCCCTETVLPQSARQSCCQDNHRGLHQFPAGNH